MKYDQLEDLRIFNTAEEIGDRVWALVAKWNYFEKGTIGNQLVRSADSIGANIAEGYGRHHKNDNLRFLFIARGSLQETKTWIKKVQRRKIVDYEAGESILIMLKQLEMSLNAFISAKRREG